MAATRPTKPAINKPRTSHRQAIQRSSAALGFGGFSNNLKSEMMRNLIPSSRLQDTDS